MTTDNRDRFFIGGEWVAPAAGAATLVVTDAFTEQAIAEVAEAGPADVERAVAAAGAAFDGWAACEPARRAEFLRRLGAILADRADEIATVISREVGMPLKLSRRIQAGLPALVSADYARLIETFAFDREVGNSRVSLLPKGVVAAITPWNYPLHQLVTKAAAALAAGCTIVAKPSEEAPLSAFILAEAIQAAGFPAGVFNLVPGRGTPTGEALVTAPGVDAISFTGSNATGARIAAAAASGIRRVALELGGKSPAVVLDDADLGKALRATLGSCFLNSGQTCTALTRLVVPRERLAEAEDVVRTLVGSFAMGDPADPETRLGPLVSRAQRDRVLGFVSRGIGRSTRLLAGGPAAAVPEKGFFVAPTVFSNVDPHSELAQEEIFGPVLCIVPHDGDDHAVAIANGTRYGLAAAVWSADEDRAHRVARRIRAGQVDLNGAPFNPAAPFGGFKQSGYGRELGVWGLEEFLEPQSVQRN